MELSSYIYNGNNKKDNVICMEYGNGSFIAKFLLLERTKNGKFAYIGGQYIKKLMFKRLREGRDGASQ